MIALTTVTTEGKLRVLLLCSHPTQYSAPVWRLFSKHPQVEALTAYCALGGAESHTDPGFGVEVKWDVPLLDDYPWVRVKNLSLRPAVGPFFGLINPGVWRLIRNGKFDAVAIFTGYNCVTFWIALAAAKVSGVPILFGTDAHDLSSRNGRKWKAWAKKYLWPRVFGLADIVIAPSSGTVALMTDLGISRDRIRLLPYVVNNEWWTEEARKVDRAAVRRLWAIPADAPVALFCAKLQAWKRPQDALEAFARAKVSDSYLVYAGDGALRTQLEAQAAKLGVRERVRFLGFVNQSGLPSVYRGADLLVFPSEHEPFGVVVNEAMLCGLAVIVSDRVGARMDLVANGRTGFVYPCGSIAHLACRLNQMLSDPVLLREYGEAARVRIAEWSPQVYVDTLIDALRYARVSRESVSLGDRSASTM